MQLPSSFEKLIRTVERNHGQHDALMVAKRQPMIPAVAYDMASRMFAIADRHEQRSDKVELG